jgi:hypothetical protein
MGGVFKSRLAIAGVVVALVGAIAIAVPVFTTERTTDIAKLGDLKITAKEETSHVIPPFVGPAALAIGVVLIGFGYAAKR